VKRLIVTADDLGLHPGINAGILRCHRDGIVTAASLSPNGAAFEDAVRLLGGAPALDVGLHLTLVGEAPLAPSGTIPSLAPAGRLPSSFATLFRALFLGRVREDDVERELVAQVARARDAGVAVTHLDSHQHVHLHPRIFPVVLRVARRFGIGAVRAAPRLLPLRGLRSLVLAPFARRGSRHARRAGFKTPDAFLGMAETGRLDEAALLRLLSRLPPGVAELVCHPGSGDAAIAESYRWGFQWDREAEALTSPAVREAIERAGVRLVRYADL
jgi:hopanoid biosynthesis associated protein HpnK